jgi:hypothetical protein
MKRLPEIQINQFQLALLLDDEQKSFYNDILATCGQNPPNDSPMVGRMIPT